MQKPTRFQIALFAALVFSALFAIPFWLSFISYKPRSLNTEYYSKRAWLMSPNSEAPSEVKLLGLWEAEDSESFAPRAFILRDGLFVSDNDESILGPKYWTTLP